MRAAARGVAVRDGDRAVAVAFVSDGAHVGADTLVRFDVLAGEDPARRLADALATTGARALWFYGGDETARRAAGDLGMTLRPAGAVFVRRVDATPAHPVKFRPPALVDRLTLEELTREHAPDLPEPHVEVAEIARDAVGMTFAADLDGNWTELRVAIYPPHRMRGFGAAVVAAAADRIEAAGRRVCAEIAGTGGRERSVLERAGFRLADYYFIAKRAAE